MHRVWIRLAMLVVAMAAPDFARAQWERLPGFDGRFFDEVFFIDANHGWVAESYSPRILYTTNAGRTWAEGTLPGAAGSKMRDLCFVSTAIGFATGSDGLFKTTDGGRTWSDITPIALGTIPAVWFRNAYEGVIGVGGCTEEEVLFMHTTNGGRSWTSSTYTVDLDASVGGIRYSDGVWYAAGGMGKLWQSLDGENWTVANNGSGGWQEDIDVIDGTIFTASTLGGSCDADAGGRLMVLPRNDTRWVVSDMTTFPFWGVSALSATEAWAAGDEGHIYRTTNGGMLWNRYSCGFRPTDHVDDIDFVDASNGWAVGDGIFRYTGRVDILPLTVSPSRTICAGERVQLEASGGSSYRWEPAEGLSDPTSPTPVASPTTTTTYTVTAISEMGCIGTASVTITVSPKPVAAVASPQLSICAGGSVQLSASGGSRYRWEPATGLSDPTVASPVASPLVTTRYRVIVANDACADTAWVVVNVGAPAATLDLPEVTADVRDDDVELPIRMTIPQGISGCAPESITITLSFNGTLYFPRSISRGTIAENTIVAGVRRITVSFSAAELAAAGDVLTTITGNAMLGNAIETPITVDSMTWNGMPVEPSASAGRLVLTGVCMTGDGPRLLQPGAFSIAKIAPNPSTGPATIEVRSEENGAHLLEVYSHAGTRVYVTRWSANGSAGSREIALPDDLPAGTYEVVLSAGTRRDSETLIIVR